MRLISEDGTIDLPYERVAVELAERWDDGEGNVYDCSYVSGDAGIILIPADSDCDYQALPSYEINAYGIDDAEKDDVWTLGVYFDEAQAKSEMTRILLAYGDGRPFYQLTGESEGEA